MYIVEILRKMMIERQDLMRMQLNLVMLAPF
jgi:hypothetical protein